ncbi:GGDEF domain-containing protein [Hyphomonas sp.]|uniref:GGDEF domain-containing protein n=1 Tax=Hyphomonas sp. TaxID=87 RepID=UPI0025C06F66|nr:GGDEF domain-containing protein [Hyphomonas sp.]
MLAPPPQRPVATPGYSAQRSFREVCQAAIRVFNLMDKYHTAPFPNAYAVLFAYTTGSDEELVAEVNDLLRLKDQLSPYDIDSLYQEYLAEDAGTFATQGIGQAIGNEIGTVLEIIEKSLKQSDEFTSSLDTFAEKAPQAIAEDGLASVVEGLLEENRRMASLTRELNQGLSKSQSLITTLNEQLEEAQAQAMRDTLTAIPNRRTFDQRLDEAVSWAGKTNEGFCLVLAEIDSFKELLSTLGSPAGDAVLKGFAALSSASLNERDMVARHGGESFAMILHDRDLMSSYNLLVKIKHAFKAAAHARPDSGAPVSGATASFGIARYEPGMSARELIAQASSYLEDAKRSGRNLVKAKGIA